MKKLPPHKKISDINSKFDQVLEGYGVLDTKIDKIDKKLDGFIEETRWKFDAILEEIRDLKQGRITDLEKRVQRLEERSASSRR